MAYGVAQGDIFRGTGDTNPGHWISRYGTKWPILCWCATVTPSRSPFTSEILWTATEMRNRRLIYVNAATAVRPVANKNHLAISSSHDNVKIIHQLQCKETVSHTEFIKMAINVCTSDDGKNFVRGWGCICC